MDRLGIISPLLPEAACLGTRPRKGAVYSAGAGISVCVCGMGADRAASAAEELALSGMELLISWGTAGALTTGLEAGDLVIPEEIVDDAGHALKTDPTIRGQLLHRLDDCPANIYLGRIYQAAQVVRGSAEKIGLHERYKAIAVDMESAAIGAVAARRGLPFLVIRSIVDTLSAPVPQAVLDCTDSFGTVRTLALFKALGAHPGEIPGLLRLIAAFRKSAQTLRWIGSRKERLLKV